MARTFSLVRPRAVTGELALNLDSALAHRAPAIGTITEPWLLTRGGAASSMVLLATPGRHL